jgi:hypothetical protein
MRRSAWLGLASTRGCATLGHSMRSTAPSAGQTPPPSMLSALPELAGRTTPTGAPAQVVPTAGVPLDDLLAVALLIWFGVQTLRSAATADDRAAEEKEEAQGVVDGFGSGEGGGGTSVPAGKGSGACGPMHTGCVHRHARGMLRARGLPAVGAPAQSPPQPHTYIHTPPTPPTHPCRCCRPVHGGLHLHPRVCRRVG